MLLVGRDLCLQKDTVSWQTQAARAQIRQKLLRR
jgi:hypothetical protein